MKKSYKKICLFEFIVLAILIINSFESSILSLYKLPIFIFILDIIFYFMLGFEKENKKLTSEINFRIFISSVLFILIYYLSGIFIGFAKTSNYYSLYGIFIFIVPLILTIIFKEHLRKTIITKCGDNKFLIILTVILFVMFDITLSIGVGVINAKGAHDIFKYIALVLLSSISLNIFLTYLALKVSYKTCIIYLFITTLYQYLLPIVPNPSEYLKAIVDLIIPVVFIFIVRKGINKFVIEEYELTRDVKRNNFIGLIISIIISTTLIYFVSGYFRYYAISVCSNSMKGVFSRGDVVVIEQVKKKYNNYDLLKKGEVIAFRQSNTVVVHRIIRVVEVDGTKYYYTKGDANNFEDNWKITENQILGVMVNTVSKIGYPTVWFSEI